MLIAESRIFLLSRIESTTDGLDALTPQAALDAVVDFYENERATNADKIEDDGDMLLYQWGTYDFGDGLSFRLDLTRQFVDAAEEGDDGIWQLSLILHYDTSAAADTLGRGHEWCYTPAGTAAFRRFVEPSPAFVFASSERPTRVELELEQAG